MRSLERSTSGVTLIELIIVMVLMSVMASTALIFMQRMFAGYGQARDRLASAAQARLSAGRIKRELRLALPNSVRVGSSGGVSYLEFAPVVAAGRYRAASAAGADSAPACPLDSASSPDNGVLTIGAADSCFKTIGPMDDSGVAAGNWIVVFNAGAGYSGADFYEGGSVSGGNKASLASLASGPAESRVAFQSNAFAWDSPGHRFFVVANPVSYVCDPASATLVRYAGYGVQAAQPTSVLPRLAGVSSALVANNVKGCQISYAPSSIATQFGLVTIALSLATDSGDPLSLVIQSQVENAP